MTWSCRISLEKADPDFPQRLINALSGQKSLLPARRGDAPATARGRAERQDVLGTFDWALAGQVPELFQNGALPGISVIEWECDDHGCEVNVTAPIVLTFLRPFMSQLDFNRWAWYNENRAVDKAVGFHLPGSISTFVEQFDGRELSISLNPKWDDREDWYPEFEDEEAFFERLARTDVLVADAL